MPSLGRRFYNELSIEPGKKAGIYKLNSIQQALKKVNFKFHRTNSSDTLLEGTKFLAEEIIACTVYSPQESYSKCRPQGRTPLLMATNTPNSPADRELRCTEQQTELSCRLPPGPRPPGAEAGPQSRPGAGPSPPAPPPGRPLSILGSVCALLLAKQVCGEAPKEAGASEARGSNICRICFGGESGARLVRPCACRGTIAAVHRACLERWLLTACTSYCELCRHHYVVTRRHKWSLWRSVWEWAAGGGGRALAADAARGALLGAASVLGTARALHAADTLLHAAAAKGGAAALGANVFSSVLIGVIGALNGLLTTWMLLKIQEHQASWRAWRDSTVLVRVALDEPTPLPTPPTTPSPPLTDPPTSASSDASFSTVVDEPDHPVECSADVADPFMASSPDDLPDT